MNNQEYLTILKQRKGFIAKISLVVLIMALIITFVQPLEYRASTGLLLVQNNPGADAYNVSRSNQMLGKMLASVVYSDSFFNNVMNSGFSIDRRIFSNDPNELKKEWTRMNSASANGDTGVITIDTYSEDKYQADQINKAIAYTMQAKNSQYHGLGDKISVQVLDTTLVSNWPVRPNIILNVFVGIVLGLILGAVLVYAFPNRDYLFFQKKNIYADYDVNQELNSETETIDPYYAPAMVYAVEKAIEPSAIEEEADLEQEPEIEEAEETEEMETAEEALPEEDQDNYQNNYYEINSEEDNKEVDLESADEMQDDEQIIFDEDNEDSKIRIKGDMSNLL